MVRTPARLALFLLIICATFAAARRGWTYVHLEGDPGQIGFQHGQLLAPRSRT
jgi:hypothetical protein